MTTKTELDALRSSLHGRISALTIAYVDLVRQLHGRKLIDVPALNKDLDKSVEHFKGGDYESAAEFLEVISDLLKVNFPDE